METYRKKIKFSEPVGPSSCLLSIVAGSLTSACSLCLNRIDRGTVAGCKLCDDLRNASFAALVLHLDLERFPPVPWIHQQVVRKISFKIDGLPSANAGNNRSSENRLCKHTAHPTLREIRAA